MTWTAPRTWTDGETVTAVEMNAHVRDNLKAIGDAWAAYTPTFTNLTLGASTVAANYSAAGKAIRYRGKLTLGAGFAITGQLRISLPAAHAAGEGAWPIGQVALYDTSAATYRWWFAVGATSTDILFTDASDTRVTSTVPWTWAAGDIIRWETEYESA